MMKLNRLSLLSLTLPVLITTACSSTMLNAVIKSVPARIIAVNNASRAELQRIVASALKIPTVQLASDALTHGSVLIIERNRLFGMNTYSNNTNQARNERDKPSVFRLVKSGEQCILTLQGTNKRWALRNTQCEAVKPPMTVSR